MNRVQLTRQVLADRHRADLAEARVRELEAAAVEPGNVTRLVIGAALVAFVIGGACGVLVDLAVKAQWPCEEVTP